MRCFVALLFVGKLMKPSCISKICSNNIVLIRRTEKSAFALTVPQLCCYIIDICCIIVFSKCFSILI